MHEMAPNEGAAAEPLAGLTVLDLSTALPGALASQFLADAGADVLMVEPPGGHPLRSVTGWPGLARGKSSRVLDLHDDADNARVWELVRRADVLVTTFRPRTAARLGFTPDKLGEVNPQLVSAGITGWGAGPDADLQGYEALVMARWGVMHSNAPAAPRPGPAFVSTPYASWGAAQTALHGILCALYERESSGRGQHVHADLVRGLSTMDTYSYFMQLVALRWPDAFSAVGKPWDDDGTPRGRLIYNLLSTPTSDGHWLQFAQAEPRLFAAFAEELGLSEMLAEPKWADFPDLADPALRLELWEIMIDKARSRTLDEWNRVFAANPSIQAERFRTPTEAFGHPQLVHDGRIAVVDDPDLGPVRQPSTMVHSDGAPITELRPAPRLGEGGSALLTGAGTPRATTPDGPAPSGLPLEGVTVLELGSMFAGPYGATLLTDLGARVIKVEPLAGDTMRRLAAFPEAGGAKVLQGKESVALDLNSAEGLKIVHRIAERADIVVQTYRAGAAERARVDAKALRAVNPGLIYLNAPGYGTDGPFGRSPAYAPSMGAASGLALSNVPDAAGATDDLAEIKSSIIRLYTAAANQTGQADGVAASGAASAMLLGLLARRRGRPMGALTTTMLATATHCLIDRNVDYEGRPDPIQPDRLLHGYSALYRLYEAAEGHWLCLAAPQEREWGRLATALAPYTDLAGDERFATVSSRAEHDGELAGVLAAIFLTRPNDAWEKDLRAADIGCVAVTEVLPEKLYQNDASFEAGYCVNAMSPVFDEHRRLDAATHFSRSRVRARGGCLTGEHTDAVLAELGYDEATVADLHARGVIG
ncbi:hypothetical protein M271_49335 [Streptomyces rapamycinicus NRRL 5491]|uniref:Fatty acid-CoA racemase n=3 Tax=Streptomyces rapamycinicus TaxID=1226757 RepID=A0A0A0NUW1_STRRN|nr:CoA transferase [Streptomyces rapamycinicus]AGP61229.1 hypothetical protein M271_49335 [Streptomyces rapamycinicus NRRL 5491]MBB4787593.1 crotonobetainyl-CoA:carnitine CoA-transferase CaiB-like acyl-CoA transferase [Streptomyces rapamycinicus]RLV71935.1 fatty acid-CoA racemase [Streptomyces rapamycinicus NRRL 5491]